MGRARLVTAGILLVLGVALVANRWFSSRIASDPASSVEQLRALAGRPKLVTPRLALDWEHRRYRARSRDTLYAADPRTVPRVSTLGPDLVDRLVTVASDAPPVGPGFACKPSRRREGRGVHLCAPDATGFVWFVSERLKNEEDAKRSELLARSSHTGRVVSFSDAYDTAPFAEAYRKSAGHPLPPTAIALVTEEPVPAGDPVDTWVPSTGTDDVWVVFDGTPSSAPSLASGIAERASDRTVIYAGDADAYRARRGEGGRVSWIGVIVVAVAALLFAARILVG